MVFKCANIDFVVKTYRQADCLRFSNFQKSVSIKQHNGREVPVGIFHLCFNQASASIVSCSIALEILMSYIAVDMQYSMFDV